MNTTSLDVIRIRNRSGGSALAALLLLLLAACGGGGDSAPPDRPAAVARVQITPGAAMLTDGAGATRQLSAQAFDADGQPLDVPVAWRSSREAALSVDANGLLTAQSAVGSAQIIATAGGISSAPMLAIAAKPATGVLIVDDADLVGDPTDTDPSAVPGVGNTYQVTLNGLSAPAPGTLVLGRGEKPLAGRVVASTSMGVQTLLTLQLVPLAELFEDLRLDEQIPLANADVIIASDVSAQFDIAREGDTWRFTPKPGATRLSARKHRSAVVGTHARDILPFRSCEIGFAEFDGIGSLPIGLDGPPTMSLSLSPSYDLRYTRASGLERLVVQAEPALDMSAALKATAQLTGQAKCKLQLFALRIPIAGPLAFFVGGMVPVGVGFDFEIAGVLSDFKVGATNRAGMRVSAGITCAPGAPCDFSASADNFQAGVTPQVEAPSTADFRLEPKLDLYAYFEAEFGNPFMRSLRFQAIDTRIGARLQGSFAPPATQIADAAYASSYGATLRGSAKAGTGISEVVALLGLGSLTQVAMSHEIPVAASPRIESAVADRTAFAPGDTVNVRVSLAPATLDFVAGLYNVDSVQLRRRVGSGSQELLATQAAGSAQREFVFAVTATYAGDVSEWYAFVQTRLPGESLSLELGRVGASSALTLVDRVDARTGECTASVDPGDDGPPGAFQRIEASLPASCVADAGVARAQAAVNASASGPGWAPGDAITATAPISFSASLVVETSISVTGTIQRAGAHARGGQSLGWTIQASAPTRVRATLTASSAAGGQAGSQVSVRAADGTLRTVLSAAGTHELTLLPGDRLAVGLGVEGEAATNVNPLPTDAPPLPTRASVTASVELRFDP